MSWHAASDPAKPEEILARVQGHDILINKEMPLSGDLIHALPPSVRLICEVRHGRNLTLTLTPTLSRSLTLTRPRTLTLALREAGTGFNNVDVGAAAARLGLG